MLAFSKLASAQAMCLSCRTKSLSPRDVLAVAEEEETPSLPAQKQKSTTLLPMSLDQRQVGSRRFASGPYGRQG